MRRTVRLAALMLLTLSTPAAAQDETDFYKNKTISIVVGFAPGGSYDAYARLLGRHIGRYIPASPRSSCRTCPARVP
ncbi:MAG: hypothetical protein K2Y71_05945 [Xanthobacteraceae bacterium]|nr:hypothetical protein [Xanthobacteraceae bacterium]